MQKEHSGGLELVESGLVHLKERLEQRDRIAIAGLGDSLTYGWMVDRGFFDRFLNSLGAAFPGAHIEGINAGVPGSTAADGLRRLPGVLRARPDLLIVQFGLNDCFSGISCQSFLETTRQIVSRALRAGSRVALATSCPVAALDFMAMVRPFYRGILELASKLKVAAADLAGHWEASETELPGPGAGLYQSDGVHPTDLGHEIMAEGLLRMFGI